MKRRETVTVSIGNLKMGSAFPVRIQSMTTTDTMETEASVAQSIRMIRAGCELVRLTAPSINEANNLLNIKNELRKKGGWKPSQEPVDILEQVEEIAEPIIEKMRKEADEALKKDIGYTENDEAVDALNAKYNPSKMPEGRIAKHPQTGEPMAKIVQGRWVAL